LFIDRITGSSGLFIDGITGSSGLFIDGITGFSGLFIDGITLLRSTSYGRAGRINRMVLGGITDSIAWQTVLNVSGINRY